MFNIRAFTLQFCELKPSGQNRRKSSLALYFECRINKNALLFWRYCPLGRNL